MLPYAAYLRVYEPVTAFPEPARTLWTAYADSRRRPRRIHALAAEHREATLRLAAFPPEPVPERESRHAYVRRSADMIYVSPWETRLRSWLAFDRFVAALPAGAAEAFVPSAVADGVVDEFGRWKAAGNSLNPHILSSTWHVPLAWFVAFGGAERCLLLGEPATGEAATGEAATAERKSATCFGENPGRGPATAAVTRTLIYVTAMAEARRRVAAALRVVRDNLGEGTGETTVLAAGQVETLGRWLGGFHPRALVELDYGGLVHLLDDRTLRADESVGEIRVALEAMERGEAELAVAMYKRLLARWRPVRALESAN
ncbi:hypothetical protein ACGFNU_01320 [Spirillospora sp. NPDC048911]|uniref:hypothetical protein n=1 Tax=Spirillospora sp. NPDC048911 TaxID=3364527 RepID=UPI003717654F